MLVAAMNPCPCGFRGDARRACRCSPIQIERYSARISGPLRDRIDLVVDVPAVATSVRETRLEESSVSIRRRVVEARERQRARLATASVALNSQLSGASLRAACALDGAGCTLLEAAIQRYHLSARGRDRVLRVSRTIADLAAADTIAATHVAEAVQYRFASSDLRSG
jgi:magnesium chelatase family protein